MFWKTVVYTGGLKKQLPPPGSLCSAGWKGRHNLEQGLEAVLGQLQLYLATLYSDAFGICNPFIYLYQCPPPRPHHTYVCYTHYLPII